MSGELAVVTGASRGIGRAIALALARRGLDIALFGRLSAALDETREACRTLGVNAAPFSCDLSSRDEIRGACHALVEELGAPRVVVNNAAVIQRGARIHEARIEDWDRVMSVNVRGPFLVMRALLPAMLASRRGRFIQIASISATLGSPGAASYAASKWAVVGLTKSLAEELRGTGLQSIAILPGSVDTDMLAGSGFTPKMTATDVANTVVYAALDAPAAMTGAAIEVFG
jgi:3-oxoacyl-[acyl-carrier protein] reductase